MHTTATATGSTKKRLPKRDNAGLWWRHWIQDETFSLASLAALVGPAPANAHVRAWRQVSHERAWAVSWIRTPSSSIPRSRLAGGRWPTRLASPTKALPVPLLTFVPRKGQLRPPAELRQDVVVIVRTELRIIAEALALSFALVLHLAQQSERRDDLRLDLVEAVCALLVGHHASQLGLALSQNNERVAWRKFSSSNLISKDLGPQARLLAGEPRGLQRVCSAFENR